MEEKALAEKFISERYSLATARIAEIENETITAEPYRDYFQKVAAFLSLTAEAAEFVESGMMYQAGITQLKERNHRLYEDILPGNYDKSYANPAFTEKVFGEDYGKILSFLYTELRSLIGYAHEKRKDLMLIRMELFLQVYGAFVMPLRDHHDEEDQFGGDRHEEKDQAGSGHDIPGCEEIRQIIYSFMSDYARDAAEERIAALLDPDRDFATDLIMNSDIGDIRYLYYYGEYVTDNEIAMAEHMLSLPESVIQLMADTFTEGYRKGFELTGKDIGKKKTVNIRYCLGFERMIRQAVLNFAGLNLRPVIFRASATIMEGKSVSRIGYYGAIPNKQYDYDHKDDQALVLDKPLVTKRLKALQAAYEKRQEQAAVFGGPAVVEVFGEKLESPAYKEAALHLSERQQKLVTEYMSAAGEIQNRYIPGEERSYTIIAFPTPEIGEAFGAIFNETIRINTLEYDLYRDMQQIMIDTLDRGDYVLVKGMGANRTDLKICLQELGNPEKETAFENCVADVNIPVGEVFTSPRLKGTEGILHIPRVFLNELEYQELILNIKDGMITSYGCANFDTEAENHKYVKDNLLFHHESLPMGEFAIGINTTAYMVGKKYDISDRFPILIAEKTGPHFAFGDTCYSHAEDIAVYNADGKEIIARDNEISLTRKTEPGKAYFNCHTDITIPYDELGELSAVTSRGEVITIIREGRFVLDGLEELNKPFDNE